MNDNEERCKNCKYFSTLKLFQRYVATIGGHGAVCGWKVGTKCNVISEKEYGCCTVFLEEAGRIYETCSTDRCEKWKLK